VWSFKRCQGVEYEWLGTLPHTALGVPPCADGFIAGRESQDLHDVEIISTDPIGRIQKLKTEQGNGIWLCGGGNLAYQLLPEIDELVLKLYPIVIGSGVPLFAGEFRPEHFTLAERIVYDNGVALLSYTK
jgi:dihydrofolate reductase